MVLDSVNTQPTRNNDSERQQFFQPDKCGRLLAFGNRNARGEWQ
jgi:hypothetical protein